MSNGRPQQKLTLMIATNSLRGIASIVAALFLAAHALGSEPARTATKKGCGQHVPATPYIPTERAKEIGEFVVGRDRITDPLQVAVWTMNEGLAARAIAEGADPDGTFPGNKQPLIVIAAMQGNPHVIAALLSAGAHMESSDGSGTPLYWSARESHLSAVRLLLACGANANFRAEDGATPLHMAIGYRHDVRVAEALIDAGADLEARQSGETPLMQAALFGRLAWVELLIKRGANVNAVAPNGTNVLGFARALANNPKIISLLEAAGAR